VKIKATIVWQADFYRVPKQDAAAQPLWQLLMCDRALSFTYEATCKQSEVSANWLIEQLQKTGLPDIIEVFRPQTLNLLATAGQQLGIKVEATRRTTALKQWLQARSSLEPGYNPLAIDKPPPLPLPEKLWGEAWRFATLPAGDLVDAFASRPIPILEMPEFLHPIALGLRSTIPVPGVIIDGGRQSMKLARWIKNVRPVALNYIPGAPDGLILEAGLVDRWVMVTFEDAEVAAAGKGFQQRLQLSRGLHFLLVQPDNSGMTYSGFWLLRDENWDLGIENC